MKLVLKLTISLTALSVANGVVNVKLNSAGHQYSIPVNVSEAAYDCVVDSGNAAFSLNQNYIRTFNASAKNVCVGLIEDGTGINYVAPWGSHYCGADDSWAEIGGVEAWVGVILETGLQIQNPFLHDWVNTTKGDIGVGYCVNHTLGNDVICNQDTAFQKLLQNSTTEESLQLTFGLDLNDPDSPFPSVAQSPSTIQMGGVSAEYANTIDYMKQPVESTSTPQYHEFILENFNFCGTNTLAPYANSWEVLPDTGSSCLSLPSEIYDSFSGWFDNSTAFTDLATMPAFSFNMNVLQVGDSYSPATLFIPLGSLVIDPQDILTEPGAPFIQVGGVPRRLCVLKGGNIRNSFGGYNSPPPTINFGTLALQALYFTADFGTYSVGLANKLTAQEIAQFNTSTIGCQAATPCKGDQKYISSGNYCVDPDCDDYFFVTMDADTKTCVYKPADMTFGLLFVLLILCAEVVSYFVVQYSTVAVADPSIYGLTTEAEIRRFRMQRGLDPFSVMVGRFLSQGVDLILIYGLKWVPAHGRMQPATPATAHI